MGNLTPPTSISNKMQTALTTADPIITIPVSILDLSEIWHRYTEARKTGKSPSTLRMYEWVANHIDRCPLKLPSES